MHNLKAGGMLPYMTPTEKFKEYEEMAKGHHLKHDSMRNVEENYYSLSLPDSSIPYA